MEPINELTIEELEKVAGGSWTYETLTDEEKEEYNAIGHMIKEAKGSSSMTVKAANLWLEFKDGMNAKYGN